IFEIGEHNGDTYIAMEYVDGHTLRDKIVGAPPRGRPKTGQAQGPAPTEKLLSFDEITDIATQICEGLSEAHKAGISHRDIKPENIIIDKSGRAKLLDFGLAQMQDVSRLTRETSTVGTAKYMSPEQYKSEDLDHRTDIWSFGVVLFEMLTGKIPFQGEYEAAVMYSVVNTEPESTRSIRPDIPKYFDVIISKCLEKNPADRFQSMLELSGELTLPSSVARIDPEPETEIERSIVVLPFENMSSDPEQEYFSDGLTEEIITDLSHIHDLRVISRNSAMMLKGSRKETKTIARELNVQYVLEGSVRKAGNNLRITAQLINAPVDDHVWAEKYDGTLDDIFDIQEKVSRSIVDALKVKLTQKESKQVANRPVDNIHAYDYYLKARHEMWKWTENSQKLAIKYLEESLKIVGNNALLYGSLGNAYWNLADISDNPEEYLKKAEDYAHKANDLESNHYLSFLVLGLVSATLGDGKQYVKNLEKSLELYSESPDGLFFLSFAYIGYLGKTEDAEVLVKKLLDIDPLNPTYNFLPGYIQFFNGQFDLAEKNLEKTYNTDPENSYVKMGYILALTYNQQYEKAFNISSFSIKTSPENKISQFCHCLTLALRGEKENARVILNKIKSRSFLDGWDTWFIAMCDALINEKEDALDGLEKAVDRGFINYPFLNEYDPFLENIRNEPRFKKLMKRVKHEWENFDSENPQPYIEEEETELPETQEKSIIVLPFDDMSPDKDNEYFSDGLTEEIITDLSHIHDLLVISRSSAMTFKGKDQTIPEIVKKVNVRYVLEGSVRKAGNNLRITAQLIDATTDVHLWAEKYSGTLDDIFDIQEKVSRSIVDALKVKLLPEEDKQIAERPIDNVQAYECYLKAKKEILTFTKDGLNRAIQHLQNGLSIIGENSLFYAGMSYAYMQHANLGADSDEYLLKMQQYSEKAFELDPDSPHTLFGLGLVDLFNRKIKMAGSRF
ncbi:MAG: protein kinase, partial [bacterium]|nr:protein kinase [bacterium]